MLKYNSFKPYLSLSPWEKTLELWTGFLGQRVSYSRTSEYAVQATSEYWFVRLRYVISVSHTGIGRSSSQLGKFLAVHNGFAYCFFVFVWLISHIYNVWFLEAKHTLFELCGLCFMPKMWSPKVLKITFDLSVTSSSSPSSNLSKTTFPDWSTIKWLKLVGSRYVIKPLICPFKSSL